MSKLSVCIALSLILIPLPTMAAMQWFSLGYFKYPDIAGSKIMSFDLGKANLASARYVKIVNAGSGASIDAIVASRFSGSDGYADEVTDFFVGRGGDAKSMETVLGEPDYGTMKVSYAKIGKGGWITLDMGPREEIIDGPGDDFEIYSVGSADAIEVYVSSGEPFGELHRLEVGGSAFGSISVESNPGTVVYMDGKEIGEVPRWLDNVTVGSHEIMLKNPHDTFKDLIRVEAYQVTRIEHSFSAEVPKLFRLTEKAARDKLKAAGFRVKIKYTTNEEYPFGRVIAQSPKGGEKADAGSTVEITVNRETRY